MERDRKRKKDSGNMQYREENHSTKKPEENTPRSREKTDRKEKRRKAKKEDNRETHETLLSIRHNTNKRDSAIARI